MTTMRAVRFHEYGPATNLVVDEIERPAPGAGEVLVKVHAAGVNPIDWKLRSGILKDYMPLTLPHTGGFDLAGTVEELGSEVTQFKQGDQVFGRGAGAYAEFAIVNQNNLAAKAAELSFEQAASIPIGAATAWAALFDGAQLESGQRVLIHGAAGGVGLWATQLAHWKGAHVIGTASTKNLDFVRDLGADEVIDYTVARFEDVVSDIDAVIDTVGGEVQERSWPVIKKGGVLVSIAAPASPAVAAEHGVRLGEYVSQATSDRLTTIARLVVEGTLRTEVGEKFQLDQLAEAHALSETHHGRGRIVVTVDGS